MGQSSCDCALLEYRVRLPTVLFVAHCNDVHQLNNINRPGVGTGHNPKNGGACTHLICKMSEIFLMSKLLLFFISFLVLIK